MLKMFHYMKERWYYLVMILLLLFVQAFCDLSLPDYTSDIINVGIQQKGIEDGVPEKLREESADKLFLFMDQEDREQVQEDYTLTNGMYELKDISSEEREELNNILGVPELIVTGLSDPSSKEVAQIKEQMGLDQDANIFQILEQIPKEQLSQMLSGMEEQFEQMPDSIVTQSAVLFVQDEYSAQGQDLDQMQMEYILFTGAKMLGLAFDGITSLSVKPIRLITGFGCVVALVSFIGVIWAIVQAFLGHTVSGWASTTSIICFVSGVQLICLGVIGEYIGKIYLETKGRPRFLIREVLEDTDDGEAD